VSLPPGTDDLIRSALAEDLGSVGDITTRATVAADAIGLAKVEAREAGTVSGLRLVERVFRLVDPELRVQGLANDGDRVGADTSLAEVRGNVRSILEAERTALNFLGRLSGIATATRRLVDLVDGTGVAVADTRKTTPGLRALEKMAVRHGGGINHRFGLYDAVLIKDNHIAAMVDVSSAIRMARGEVGHTVKIEVEVETIDQLREALDAAPDIVMLDNMSLDQLREAVAIIDGCCVAEASGGITETNIRNIAETGIDMVSSGSITHSAPALDVALELRPA